jgi:membrane protein
MWSISEFREIFMQWKAEALRDRVISVAAGVAFFAVLSVVPVLTALISIFGLVAEPEDVPQLLAGLTEALPEEAGTLLTDQATRIAGAAGGTLSLTALVALVVALWSANGGTKALIEALDVAYDVEETRGFVRLNLVALGFTLGGMVAVVVLGAVGAALPALLGDGGWVLALRWPLILGLLLLALAALYRWGPDRPDADWVWISPGAVLAGLGILLGTAGFGWYVSGFGSYGETYGSLAAVVILMLWLWLSTLAVLAGAELNAVLDRRASARQA